MPLPVVLTEGTYCGDDPYYGSDLSAYEPVFVVETQEGERVPAGAFCNDACLDAHVEESGLTSGAACP